MTRQHPQREASPRVIEGSSTLPEERGRLSAPHLAVWIPLATKVAAAALAAVVLAAIGAKAGAHVPLAEAPSVETSSAPPIAQTAPPFGPDAAPSSSAVSDGGAERERAVLADGRIVLNLASEEELTRLPGVGPSRARAILALRQRLTKFRAVEDLLRVRGIGRKTLRRLRPSLVLDRPADEPRPEPPARPSPAEGDREVTARI